MVCSVTSCCPLETGSPQSLLKEVQSTRRWLGHWGLLGPGPPSHSTSINHYEVGSFPLSVIPDTTYPASIGIKQWSEAILTETSGSVSHNTSFLLISWLFSGILLKEWRANNCLFPLVISFSRHQHTMYEFMPVNISILHLNSQFPFSNTWCITNISKLLQTKLMVLLINVLYVYQLCLKSI